MAKIEVNPEIRSVWLKDIVEDSENPRAISDEALSGLRQSLEKFGYVDLLVVNKRDMKLIAGHQRLKILKDAGVKRVKAVFVDFDEAKRRMLNITLNNQQICGYFTAQIIPLLEQIRNSYPDDYVSLRLQELREELNDLEEENIGKTLPDDIPEAPKEAITRPGDLWVLGQHRLLCGDSTKEEDVGLLMQGEKAALFATDPPYCVDYTGLNKPNSGKDWSDVYHEVDIKDAEEFFRSFLQVGLAHIADKAPIYVWHASRRYALLEKVFNELGILAHQTIVWVKPAAIQTFSIYYWRHEPCLLGWKKGHKPFFRVSQNKIGSVWYVGLEREGDPTDAEYYYDIWEVDWQGKKRPPQEVGHPTIKPTEVFAIPMRVHTKPGDICFEPFSGSGSQIIAGERMNRRVFAMELEPVFCDVAVKRWEEFTGEKAKLGRGG